MKPNALNRRRFLFLSAVTAAGGVLALASTPAEAAPPQPTTPALPDAAVPEPALATPDDAADAVLEEVQWGKPPPYRGRPRYYRPPPRRRRRRCWVENVRVRYVDRFGRVFWRVEPRRICR